MTHLLSNPHSWLSSRWMCLVSGQTAGGIGTTTGNRTATPESSGRPASTTPTTKPRSSNTWPRLARSLYSLGNNQQIAVYLMFQLWYCNRHYRGCLEHVISLHSPTCTSLGSQVEMKTKCLQKASQTLHRVVPNNAIPFTPHIGEFAHRWRLGEHGGTGSREHVDPNIVMFTRESLALSLQGWFYH